MGRTSPQSSSLDAELITAVCRASLHISAVALLPPVHYAAHRNEESIPTYLVGHTTHMGELRCTSSAPAMGGWMKVIGAGVGGVSIADCVKAGQQGVYEVGTQIGN